jgi:FlaA1/EpsC-like NDP-sugar epimerase
MIQELGPNYGFNSEQINVQEIGTKPGEKLYEELMSDEETRRSVELENYFAVLPAFRGIYKDIAYDYSGIIGENVNNAYVSAEESSLTISEVVRFLKAASLLGEPDYTNTTRYWPGDKESTSNQQ